MKVQVQSDLHVEFGNGIPPPAEDADAIVLAGDLAPYRTEVLKQVADAWAGTPVLYVPGIHEFYGG